MVMSKKHKLIGVLVVVVIIVAVIFLVRFRKRQLASQHAAKVYATVIRTAKAHTGSLRLSGRYLGEIVPMTENAVASKLSGYVVEIGVDDGDRVTAGEILVRIDDREINRRIDELEAQVRQARATVAALQAKLPGLRAALTTTTHIHTRDQALYRAKAISREELDISDKNHQLALAEVRATESSIQAARASVAALENRKRGQQVLLDYAVIRAPFSGLVSRRLMSVGDLAVPGKPILTLVRPEDGVKVVVPLALEDFSRVKTGSGVVLRLGKQRMEAKVSSLYPSTDPRNLGLCNIRLAGTPFQLPYHSRIEVLLAMDEVRGLVAPIGCLVHESGGSAVVRIDSDKHVHIEPVELLGETDRAFCFKSERIHDGDVLAVGRESRLMRLYAGQLVAPVE